jgi:tetratricopeptide (TPR) repeat protein
VPQKMRPLSAGSRRRRSAAAVTAASLALAAGCRPGAPPAPGSPEYDAAIRAFYVGLAALESGEDAHAESNLTALTKMLPNDPAVWADMGLLQLRQGQADRATESLTKAGDLASQFTGPGAALLQARIEALRALLENRRGQSEAALDHLRKALALAPDDLRLQWSLAQTAAQTGGPAEDAEYRAAIAAIEKARPNSLAVLIESARIAALSGDGAALRDRIDRIASQRNATWPADAGDLIGQIKSAASASPRSAAPQLIFLRNVLKPDPAYRLSVGELEGPSGQIGEAIPVLATIPMPQTIPAAPDAGLTYRTAPLPGGKAVALRAVSLDGQGIPAVFGVDAGHLRRVDATGGAALPFPSGGKTPTRDGILSLDWNYTFKPGLALAGAGGLRLLAQEPGGLTDVTAKSGLPASITGGAWAGLHTVDFEADGNLDIVAIPRSGPVVVLRNNGDETFKPILPFVGLRDVAEPFVWADIEASGTPDAVFVSATGAIRVFSNQRSGQFREIDGPKFPSGARVAALTPADLHGRGILDLVAWATDGKIYRLALTPGSREWTVEPVARTKTPPPASGARLFSADFDNNGAVDLLASAPGAGAEVFLFGAPGAAPVTLAGPHLQVQDVADLDGSGLLSLIGVAPDGTATVATAKPTKKYQWQVVRPRAKEAAGDQRINTFGIGGQMQVRAGLNVETVPITGPFVHFGLGDAPQADVVRIVWPNGSVRSEFDLKSDQTIIAEQRLKGSCPFLFAWDGRTMGFVTDCIWRSPLGLKINAQTTAGVGQTEDWVRIRGDQLRPRDGVYDLRVTADLWETHYFDRLALMAVDHPADTEIWVDERFAPERPVLDIVVTRPRRPIARAVTDTGHDVRELLAARDGRYVDDFGRGKYQGVTRDHYLEIALPADAPADRPLYLICNGWIHPTDASINVALSHSNRNPIPEGLTIETPDAGGVWQTARARLGFPTGKLKTVVLRVDDLWLSDATDRSLRLRTNLEIFWDEIAWAEGVDDAPVTRHSLDADRATLGYRGFSDIRAKDESSPELPRSYDALAGTGPRWRDLDGYYTRYGEVGELLRATDDRYVIMNAGDEIRLEFPVPAPPAPGCVRDFVLIGDGWVKDGDYNTTWGGSVQPLPSHDVVDYPTPPGALADDPVYRAHAQDWERYHTRYVAPEAFRTGLAVAR